MRAPRIPRHPTPRRNQSVPVPFNQRARENVARVLRRTRLLDSIGTLMLVVLFTCGAAALAMVVKLSADPRIVRPW
jgi:hypothetical protein